MSFGAVPDLWPGPIHCLGSDRFDDHDEPTLDCWSGGCGASEGIVSQLLCKEYDVVRGKKLLQSIVVVLYIVWAPIDLTIMMNRRWIAPRFPIPPHHYSLLS
jgi:hypothetical protein